MYSIISKSKFLNYFEFVTFLIWDILVLAGLYFSITDNIINTFGNISVAFEVRLEKGQTIADLLNHI